MTDAWLLDLVAQVARHEDEHGEQAKGWKCHSVVLDQVPQHIRHEAAGYAAARTSLDRAIMRQVAERLEQDGYSLRRRCEHYGLAETGETLDEQRDRQDLLDQGGSCTRCPAGGVELFDVLERALADVLYTGPERVDQAVTVLLERFRQQGEPPSG